MARFVPLVVRFSLTGTRFAAGVVQTGRSIHVEHLTGAMDKDRIVTKGHESSLRWRCTSYHCFLPIYDNTGCPVPHGLFARVRDELTEVFGGVTAFPRTVYDK